MRSPMRNKFSVLVFVHADVESTDGLTNFSRLQSDLEVTSEPLKHRICIELAFRKSMLSPDNAQNVPMLLWYHDRAGGTDKPTLERPCTYRAGAAQASMLLRTTLEDISQSQCAVVAFAMPA